MAVTFTPTTPFNRQVIGTLGASVGVKLTCSGTTTDNGDQITAANVGLTSITHLQLDSNAVDSESNPENAFVLSLVQPSAGTFKVNFHSQAAAGATTPLAAITDGTSVANYVFYVTAYGKL